MKVFISTSFEKVFSKLKTAFEGIKENVLTALNMSGQRMQKDIVQDVAEEYAGEIPERALDSAIELSRATPLNLEVEVRAGDRHQFPYYRWITQRDEKVCPVCGPRDGSIYTAMELESLYPAHPNCRCEIEPEDLGQQVQDAGRPLLFPEMERVTADVLEGFQRDWTRG